MALPQTIAARGLAPGDLLGLRMAIGTGGLTRIFWFRLDDYEPAKLEDFSIGSASAAAVAGTGWNEILKTGTNQSYLEPDVTGIINQVWWGLTPSQAWVYSQYPVSQDRLSLLGTRSISDQHGYWSGRQTTPSTPMPETETYTLKELHPAYLGYHPFAAPATITVRLTFWVQRYAVTLAALTGPDDEAPQGIRGIIGRTVMRSVGGLRLIGAPSWLIDLASRREDWANKLAGSASAQPLVAPSRGVIRAEAPFGLR